MAGKKKKVKTNQTTRHKQTPSLGTWKFVGQVA
jgi:hypothetical protein